MFENIDVFAQAMMDAVAQSHEFTVSREKIQKLQNPPYNGMLCRRTGKKTGIVINLDTLFEAYRAGENMEDILAEVLSVLHSPLADGPFADEPSADGTPADRPSADGTPADRPSADGTLADKSSVGRVLSDRPSEEQSCANDPFTVGLFPAAEDIACYEKMREHLRICLVPVKGNEAVLPEIPYRKIGDLAVVYKLIFEREENEASILIKNEMLRIYGITETSLEKDALEVSLRRFPLKMENLGVILFGTPEAAGPLWFVGTECGIQGAGVLAYPDTFEKIAGRLGSGYYIIPSSVHEVLVIADGEAPDTDVLDSMISEVNLNEVSPQERLSDHCYHYDPEEKRFETGREYKNRE